MSSTQYKKYPHYTADENPKFIDFRTKESDAIVAIDGDIHALETVLDGLGSLATKNSVTWSEISNKPLSFAPATHNHSEYMTADSVDSKITAAIAAIPVYDGTVTEV